SNSNNKKIINNILFTNFNNQWFANTLANKNLKINELKFPSALDVTDKNQNKYSISNYFYDSETFKNVNKILFNDENYEIGMSWFGIESFANCNILDEEINFNYLEDIDNKYGNFVLFRNNSFYNTNIKRLNISISSSNLELDSYSFSNNKNLNDFNISCSNDVNSWFYLSNYLLSDCNNLTSFNLISNNLLLSSYLFKGANKLNSININTNKLFGLSEFVFANDYDSFNLKLLFKASDGDFDSNSFSNINVNIEKFNMEVSKNPSIKYPGLTEEQKNKIIYI
ncbi:MAG: leucine-rich repeat domain-containing protein, partial [Ureaplasma sp.]|nr:leucine-rich repeat domain-containing protein [Ureaplasma sp.]